MIPFVRQSTPNNPGDKTMKTNTDASTVTVTGTLVTWTGADGQPREAYAKSVKAADRVARRITARLAAGR